jgi:LEA14-like dessication related protein
MIERLRGRRPKFETMIGSVPLCAALLLLGCAGGPGSAPGPAVGLMSLQMLGPTADGQRFDLALRITNTGAEPLAVTEIRYSVRLGGEGYLNGRSVAPVAVPAGQTTTVHIVSESAAVSSGSRLLAMTQGPQSTLPYELTGDLVVDNRPQRPLAFQASGNVPLSMAAD